MKIRFHLPYRAAWGESLRAVLTLQTGRETLRRAVELRAQEAELWTGETDFSLSEPAALTYFYEVLSEGKLLRREWNAVPRRQTLSPAKTLYELHDFWRDLPASSWLYSSALAGEAAVWPDQKPCCAAVVLRAQIPGLAAGQTPFLCGDQPALGGWNPARALPLRPCGVNEWAIQLNAKTLAFPALYKFIVKSDAGPVQWEPGPDRALAGPPPKDGETVVYSGLTPHFSLPAYRAAGVVLPVFSIRTEKDWGAGDFGSLKTLADWAAATGQKFIQILPVNDTTLTRTWQDSYPYNSVSVYAFHPLYADMSALPPLSQKEETRFETERARLNALPSMDYEAVCRLKTERLEAAFQADGEQTLASAPFKEFLESNLHWLPAYAMFSALRDRYGTADFAKWPRYARFCRTGLREFFNAPSRERLRADYYLYMQFLLHRQLTDARRYAREKGVALKGDIPIGVSPKSADAWAEPALFNLNAQAGAPPDDFSAVGQNWGFPTYNWEEMAKDGYGWWKRRFTHMARYFDAYRIDHVLGFFRIWEIPSHSVQGLLGQFTPALPMSAREIESFGLPFKETYLQPYISDELLKELFAQDAEYAKRIYLLPRPDGLYALRPDYDTQRKTEAAFSGREDERSRRVRDGLYALASNVLFVRDRAGGDLYHPRIGALKDAFFRALPARERAAFERLYNDYFYRRHDEFWKNEAFKKLPALTQATRMLCCAEDLGMIPHCVPEVMHALQMLSLEIQRMPKRLGDAFARPAAYPYLSVATPSTHDMSVLRGWWRENPALTARFWREELGRAGDPPANAPADACEQIAREHLQSPSMLCMLSFQDWTAMDQTLRAPDVEAERVNVPANPRHYWRYRMHLTAEELLKQDGFNRKIRELIRQSGR